LARYTPGEAAADHGTTCPGGSECARRQALESEKFPFRGLDLDPDCLSVLIYLNYARLTIPASQ